MNKIAQILTGIVIFVIVVMASGFFYTVDETQQVVITQFGKPIGAPIVEAGLHFKVPFIQVANYFDRRILRWDGDSNQIPTKDKRYIWVDTTARWRISDALKFMQSVGVENAAYARLDDVVDAAARDVISSLNLIETTRNTNRLYDERESQKKTEEFEEFESGALEKISVGRDKLTRDILKKASELVPQYGVELVDVRIKRVNYIQDVRRKVYDRMISERRRAAEKFRSEGQGKKAEIEGQMTRKLQEIQSEAYKKAEEIKGIADAKAIKVYADAYNNDSEFYAFIKTLETYKDTISSDTTIFLGTDSDYYKYLKSIKSAE